MSRVRLHEVVSVSVGLCLVLGVYEGIRQWRQTRYVRDVTARVLRDAPPDRRSEVIAIRDYIRSHVTFVGARINGRPFLRASAACTLRSGKGFCGETSRTFICMAAAAGIRAQRINLYGSVPHVVAEAEIAPGKDVIVDSLHRPIIQDLESLDDVIRRPEFDDYYTLNLRRLHMSWLVTRLRLEMGPLTYWTENPAALKAFLFFSTAAFLLLMRAARFGLRRVVVARGWVHRSEIHRVKPPPTDGA